MSRCVKHLLLLWASLCIGCAVEAGLSAE